MGAMKHETKAGPTEPNKHMEGIRRDQMKERDRDTDKE